MYSVEDLLISHGYKLPRSGAPSTTPYDKQRLAPAECHAAVVVDNSRAAGGGGGGGRGVAPNGCEVDRGGGGASSGIYGTRQALVKGYPVADVESGERCLLRRKEAGGVGNLGDAQLLGDSLATDSGFYDVPSLTYSEPFSHDERDVSYWRRRGQDFSVLLDYADGRELRASAAAWRPQALIAAEEHRAERQAQQLWEEISWLRDPDAGPGQLRVTGERKCQSLGTEEWRPAVGLGRQLSDGEGDRWALEQHRLRTMEGTFHPRTKAKSQSLPRVLSPDGVEHREVVPFRPSLPDRQQRVSSTVFSGPYSRYVYSSAFGRERWGRNAWPSSHVALLPKPRFSRPLKPPSYEIHQQTRGSAEMLAIDQGPKQKDRPIYYQRGGELQRQDYFAQHSAIFGMEPPGYIPPPSYKRPLPPRAVPMNRNELANIRWRGEALHMPSSEAGRWFSRQTGGSWLEHYGDRSVHYRRQVHPGYEEHPGHARYLPIEDPRVRQISGGPAGNSLTDSDKIRNINKEIPSAKVLGQSTHDSAFPPPQGLSLNTDSRKTSVNDNDSSNRWSNRGINKGSDGVAPELSSSQFYPSSILGRPPPPPCKPAADQGLSETVTQVKKADPPEPEKDKSKNLKKKLSETIFCLVSVPVSPQASGTSLRDQNNNDEKPPDPVDSPCENKTGHLTNQSLQSTSSAEAELQALTGSIASSKTSSRASSKMVRKLPCRPPKINHYKELKLSGSWPANQYRDQETQTSPEAHKPAPPEPENKEAQPDPAPQGTDAPSDSGSIGSTAFSFPITGVKSLKLSSNSAFSLTGSFSSQLNKSTAQPPAAPPSGNVEEAKPAESGGQETFGQFLLKPASQRPWDAVKELETINKELQDQQPSSKQPSVDQCIEDLNEAYKDILELGTASNKVPNGSVQIPERIKIRLTSEPLNKPSSLRRSAVSWSVDPEYRDVKSAFSRPATKSVTFSKQLREELPVPPRETGFREYRVVSHLSRRRSSSDGRTVKLDLPDEPIETPICDFSPMTHTTAAEVPWADRQPMQDASTLTSPPDYEDICQALRQSRDPADVSAGNSKPNDAAPLQDPSVESEEECPICKRELETQMRQGPMPPLHEEDSSDSSANQNGSPPQCTTLESPAEEKNTKEPGESGSNQSGSNLRPETREQHSSTEGNEEEKTDIAQAENLNNLCETKPAESVPENDSMEKRAARILGIDVPVDSLVTGEQSIIEPVTEELESTENEATTRRSTENEATTGSSTENEGTTGRSTENEATTGRLTENEATAGHVSEDSADKQTEETKGEREEQDSQSTPDSEQEPEKKPFAVPEHRIALRSHLGRDHPGLPEFPPDRLPLSVPPNQDHRLALSLEGERRNRGPSHRIEALQDKLAASPSLVAIERLARMKEVDSVSRMRSLGVSGMDSGEGEADGEGAAKEPLSAHQGDKEDDQEITCSEQVSKETVLPGEASSLSEPNDPMEKV